MVARGKRTARRPWILVRQDFRALKGRDILSLASRALYLVRHASACRLAWLGSIDDISGIARLEFRISATS